MIEVFRNILNLKIRELYFAPQVVESSVKRDIDCYIQCQSPICGSKPFWSTIVDLQQDEQTIFNAFAKSLRNQIRRAAGHDKDCLVVDVNMSPSAKDLALVKAYYNDFASFKGIEKANMAKLEIFRQSGCLSISSVYGTNDKLPLAINCDIFDANRCRGYYGATLPRDSSNPATYQLIGRANKLLQWETMRAMKKSGLKSYDLGGISHNQDMQGVDDFKRQFGGLESLEYNALLGVTNIGTAAVIISKLAAFPRTPFSNKPK